MAGAIIKYIQKENPEIVSLVCMGYSCMRPTDEDTLLAVFIKNVLEKINGSIFRGWSRQNRQTDGARFFEDDKQSWAPRLTLSCVCQLDRFDFVLKVEQENGLNFLRRIEL
jgi:2-phosphosulfolactate phosphatase